MADNSGARRQAEAAAQAETVPYLRGDGDAMRLLLDVVRGPRPQLKFPADEWTAGRRGALGGAVGLE